MKSGGQRIYWGIIPVKGKREGNRIGQRELLDLDIDLTSSTLVKVSNHLSLPENFPVLALKTLHPGKSPSPRKLKLLVTQHQFNGKLRSKDCPMEESYLGWNHQVLVSPPCLAKVTLFWPPKKCVHQLLSGSVTGQELSKKNMTTA